MEVRMIIKLDFLGSATVRISYYRELEESEFKVLGGECIKAGKQIVLAIDGTEYKFVVVGTTLLKGWIDQIIAVFENRLIIDHERFKKAFAHLNNDKLWEILVFDLSDEIDSEDDN